MAARVQAAETAIERMAGLLTQLAAAGALPKDVAGKLEDVKAEMDAISAEVIFFLWWPLVVFPLQSTRLVSDL